MAVHSSIPSMLQESLPEMLLVAKYSIEFQKNPAVWGTGGCYGYPAAVLLLSIADSIGSYVEEGNVENHFKILNNKDYYDLKLVPTELKVIYKSYRSLLVHHSVIGINVGLQIGSSTDQVLSRDHTGRYWLALVPLYNATMKAVGAFLGNPTALAKSTLVLSRRRGTS